MAIVYKLIWSQPADSGSGRNTASCAGGHTFVSPVTVTKCICVGASYSSTDGYSSFYNQGGSVYFTITTGGVVTTIVNGSCSHSKGSGGSSSCSVNTTDTTKYPNVTRIDYSCSAYAYSDHDQACSVSMSQYDVYITLSGGIGYIV